MDDQTIPHAADLIRQGWETAHSIAGSQQQWIARNSVFGEWVGGAWNMVMVGVPTAPPPACPAGFALAEHLALGRPAPLPGRLRRAAAFC